jgi:MFS family permease
MQPDRKSLWRLLIAQTQVVFNDNASKLALISLATLVLSEKNAGYVTQVLAALLVLPFVIFSPLCGWLADRFPKRLILKYALWLQTALMFVMMFALWLQALWLAVLVFFLLALQACVFSPAKQGALKEMVGSAHLTHAVGWMESLTIFGILLGGLAGAFLLGFFDNRLNQHWPAAALCFAALTAGCFLSIWVFGSAKTAGSQSRDPFTWGLFWNHFRDLAYLWRERRLLWPALGIAFFYALGGLLYLMMVSVGRHLHPGGNRAGIVSGEYLAIMGGGIILGALLVIRIARRRPTLGLVPLGSAGMAGALLAMALLHPAGWIYLGVLVLLGVFSSFFIVPLNTYLQDHAAEDRRSRVIAAANLLLNLGGIAAVGVNTLMTSVLDLSLQTQFLLACAPMLVISAGICRCLWRQSAALLDRQ